VDELLRTVAKGDERAFEQLYDVIAAPVYGLARRILRNPAQSEEIAQEVLVEVWRRAATFDPARGSAMSWVMTMAHHRAVDRVRAEQSAANREEKVARRDVDRPFDEVAELVATRIEHEQVRRCLSNLTDLQRESIMLAYYRGHTYADVANLLDAPLPTVKTRMRDGLIRLRDCLGVAR
jgi:RNA polymerase sigma-70 factor (ECF subfamily)